MLLGTSFKLNTLVVCHCFRQDEKIVRIISARKADKDEAKAYWSKRK
ncbi:MAG: BrnT family toxin [Gammaproteobacteria bacterium]|nr:BrnT family toxin [Gammaproteobacteria bacterium]